LAGTLAAVAVKVADRFPAAMVTLAGTVAAAVFALLSDTTAPPGGAVAVNFTVPVDVAPPEIVVGLRVRERGPRRAPD
jgi:hypothetical protein